MAEPTFKELLHINDPQTLEGIHNANAAYSQRVDDIMQFLGDRGVDLDNHNIQMEVTELRTMQNRMDSGNIAAEYWQASSKFNDIVNDLAQGLRQIDSRYKTDFIGQGLARNVGGEAEVRDLRYRISREIEFDHTADQPSTDSGLSERSVAPVMHRFEGMTDEEVYRASERMRQEVQSVADRTNRSYGDVIRSLKGSLTRNGFGRDFVNGLNGDKFLALADLNRDALELMKEADRFVEPDGSDALFVGGGNNTTTENPDGYTVPPIKP